MNEIQLPPAAANTDRNEIEQAAREISGLAHELAPETERGRRLPDELVAALRDSWPA